MAGEGRRWLPLIHRMQAFLQEVEAMCLQSGALEATVATLGQQEAALRARLTTLTNELADQAQVLAASRQQQAAERETHLATMTALRAEEAEARGDRAATDDVVRRRLAAIREEQQTLEAERDRLQAEIAAARAALEKAYRTSLS